MRVVNWYKWTRFKKRVVGICFFVGFLLAFSMENGGDAYGYWAIVVLGIGATVLGTIHHDEW